MTGKVYIVGAGAGGKDFLTLKAFEVISKQADLVIYDKLISEDIIDAINPKAQKVFAGKEPKLHHMTQDEINTAIIDFAKQGKTVARLKGGDPFIFGRGGEEIEELRDHNIKYEIIPGVTAANIAACEYEIPLTYRKLAEGAIFISGHAYNDEIPNLDWQHLTHTNNTIVIYMGIGNIGEISEHLIKAGMNKNKPACAIQNAGSDASKFVKSSIVNLASNIQKNNLKNPAIIIIGEVVNKSL